ncbi:Fc.00g066410.m01.CDS01 [Cosmosporella sp. VM-42]
MEPSTTGESTTSPIKFRPGKKRKAYRQRTDNNDDAETTTSNIGNESREGSAVETRDGNDDASVLAALRLRNARKARLRGVGFTTSTRPDDETTGERALVLRDQDESQDAALPAIANRFTHQTGLLADLNDRHMMEYIESRLSNRSAPAHGTGSQDTPSPADESSSKDAPKTEGQAIMQGRLMEIDLSKEARATKVEDGARDGRGKRRRLGKDGKPWRSRNRRGSDDIKRDQLVEEILRESRLDVYDHPPQSTEPGPDEDGAADERLAEEFRRQFLDDVAQRQLKKKKPTQAAKPGTEDVLKGPKLGGSRNVRAAMRDLLLQREKQGKK